MAFTTSIELHKNTIYLTVGWFADMGPDVDLFHRACQATAGRQTRYPGYQMA